MCITPEVKLCVGLRNQDRAMATAQNSTTSPEHFGSVRLLSLLSDAIIQNGQLRQGGSGYTILRY